MLVLYGAQGLRKIVASTRFVFQDGEFGYDLVWRCERSNLGVSHAARRCRDGGLEARSGASLQSDVSCLLRVVPGCSGVRTEKNHRREHSEQPAMWAYKYLTRQAR
jgi:hypothetical protein